MLKLGSARHLYNAICLQFQNYFPPDRAVFSPKNVILILFYVVPRFILKISRCHGKIARYDVLKIKFGDVNTNYVEISSSSPSKTTCKVQYPA